MHWERTPNRMTHERSIYLPSTCRLSTRLPIGHLPSAVRSTIAVPAIRKTAVVEAGVCTDQVPTWSSPLSFMSPP